MDHNPIEIFYCWQALVIAIIIYIVTHAIKSIIPYIYEPKNSKGKMFIKRVLLPIVPPLLGFIFGIIIPIRPEILIEYVNDQTIDDWYSNLAIFGAWGAVVGQFADYVYSKLTKFIDDYRPTKNLGNKKD